MNFKSEVTPQMVMLCNCSKDPLSTDHEYVMQFLEASSVHRDEDVGNYRGDLGRPR